MFLEVVQPTLSKHWREQKEILTVLTESVFPSQQHITIMTYSHQKMHIKSRNISISFADKTGQLTTPSLTNNNSSKQSSKNNACFECLNWLVNGKWHIFPHRVNTPNQSPKICHLWSCRQPLQLHGVFWANVWNITVHILCVKRLG